MSSAAERVPPPPRLLAVTAALLALILFWVVLTTWVPNRWTFDFAALAIFALAGAWAVHFTWRPCALRVSPILIPLAGAVAIGLLQLLTAHTVNRWETCNAVLKWSVYLAAFFVASQIGGAPGLTQAFRRGLLYFGFALCVLGAVQFYTAPYRYFWVFESGFSHGPVFGPFPNPDRYAALIELILPLALFEALTDRRRMLLGAVMAGTMVASVVAGASRAGSLLVVVESAAILLLAARRGLGSARKVSITLAALLMLFTLAFTAVVGWNRLSDKLRAPDPYRARREMLTSAIAMARVKPLTGFGLGTFATVYPEYAVCDWGVEVDHAHNDWAEWADEGGLPFLGCLLAVALWSAPRLMRSLWGLGVLAVWLHACVDFPMQVPALALWLFVLLGCACQSGGRSGSLPEQVSG